MKVGEEGVDDVPILRAAKRPPKLQVPTHFKNGVSSATKRNFLDDELIANGPKRPGKDPNLEPPNVARGRRGQLEFSK